MQSTDPAEQKPVERARARAQSSPTASFQRAPGSQILHLQPSLHAVLYCCPCTHTSQKLLLQHIKAENGKESSPCPASPLLVSSDRRRRTSVRSRSRRVARACFGELHACSTEGTGAWEESPQTEGPRYSNCSRVDTEYILLGSYRLLLTAVCSLISLGMFGSQTV
jgi:hypothetical protein